MAPYRSSKDLAPDELYEIDETILSPIHTHVSHTALTSRRPSIVQNTSEEVAKSRLLVGVFAAFGTVGAGIPSRSWGDVQNGNNKEEEGGSGEGQRRGSVLRRESEAEAKGKTSGMGTGRRGTVVTIRDVALPVIEEKKVVVLEEKGEDSVSTEIKEVETATTNDVIIIINSHNDNDNDNDTTPPKLGDPTTPYPNGYQFPPKHSFQESLLITSITAWHFILTPFGFLLTLYFLNIVAWGGMLFLILIHGTPTLAHPSYDSWESPAKRWLEIDAQILNALFCVTGLGLAPWRVRDVWLLMRWRVAGEEEGWRRLAGVHRGWFRLRGSEDVAVDWIPPSPPPSLPPTKSSSLFKDTQAPEAAQQSEAQLPPPFTPSPLSCLPLPLSSSPPPPLTGERAPPTSPQYKLDLVIWTMFLNTVFQIVLNGLMWGINKYDRPGWAVGLFVGLAVLVAGGGGGVMYVEGRRVRRVEGVVVGEWDRKILRERGRGDKEGEVV